MNWQILHLKYVTNADLRIPQKLGPSRSRDQPNQADPPKGVLHI